MAIEIITNNVPRDFTYGSELTDEQKAEFDYVDDIDSHDFFIYKGRVYDTGEFMIHSAPEFEKWDGVSHDTYFSGIVIRYVNHYEQVVVGTFYVKEHFETEQKLDSELIENRKNYEAHLVKGRGV